MKSYMQNLGRSLQLPVAVLPAAALLVGIANYWLSFGPNAIATFLLQGGLAILGQLPILFAVGVALGMSEGKDGAAAFAGLVAFEVPVNVLKPENIAAFTGVKVTAVDPAFSQITNVFIGIIAGLIAAALFNRFHSVKLPMALSFFSGKRAVPIMAAFVMMIVSAILFVVWPPVYNVLVAFGESIVKLGAVGAGLYGFFNRLLIPTGLHQALNSVFWFDVAGINDIGKFLASQGPKGVTGMFQAGFFPVMMFGLPAGAFAIYKNARPERKKEVGSLMLAGAFASFFTGVTEPLEFSFMFVAWPLYVIHAVFTGISLAFAAFMHWTAGFAFSAGLVDFVLSFKNPIANMPYMLIIQGLVMAVIYYFGFDFAIKKFNIMTPGREELPADNGKAAPEVVTDANDDKYTVQAKRIYAALGGSDNLNVVDNCTTRLRLKLADTGNIDKAAIKATGVPGINVLDKNNLQIIVGTEVQFVADALSQLKEANTPVSAIEPSAAVAPADVKSSATEAGVDVEFHSVANGHYLELDQLSDPTFAQKMLGDGFAIDPTDGNIVSPVDGEVTTVFPTKHAIGFKTAGGLEVLLHMGLDTVELKGAGFDVQVADGDKVKHGQLVAKVDLESIKAAGKQTPMIVIITNMDAVGLLKYNAVKDPIADDAKVLTATTK